MMKSFARRRDGVESVIINLFLNTITYVYTSDHVISHKMTVRHFAKSSVFIDVSFYESKIRHSFFSFR